MLRNSQVCGKASRCVRTLWVVRHQCHFICPLTGGFFPPADVRANAACKGGTEGKSIRELPQPAMIFSRRFWRPCPPGWIGHHQFPSPPPENWRFHPFGDTILSPEKIGQIPPENRHTLTQNTSWMLCLYILYFHIIPSRTRTKNHKQNSLHTLNSIINNNMKR